MIQLGFHYDAHSVSDRLEERIRVRQAGNWRRLALGFGLSGAILSVLALVFLLGY
ncbi:MAG: hypothetical protein Tsb0019_16510 [Roseibium sp.]